jgi:hypothetical protein
MTRPDIAAIRAAIAKRGDCAGPLTTFPTPTLTHVAICCGENWVEVIEWLAMCERDIPALLAWCEEVEQRVEKLEQLLAEACEVAIVGSRDACERQRRGVDDRIAAIRREGGV